MAVQDAYSYQEKGYQTRICVYPVGTDGLIMGLGISVVGMAIHLLSKG